MTLLQLVEEAKSKSSEFRRKIEYWTHTKHKSPELPWLMQRLEEVLGREYVKAAALSRLKEKSNDQCG